MKKGKERAIKETGLGYPSQSQAVPTVDTDESDESDDVTTPALADVYADLPRVSKFSSSNIRKDRFVSQRVNFVFS